MSVAVQSVSTASFASASTVAIPKPSGLAVADLMVAAVLLQNGASNITGPVGWTALTLRGGTGSAPLVRVFWKVAAAADVSASTFTFTGDISAEINGAMYRITGHSFGRPIWADNGAVASNTTTPSIAATVTPDVADSLLIMVLAAENVGGTATVSGYAIATSNPTWTEAWDLNTTDGGDFQFASAYATRTQTTGTGNISATMASGSATADWTGVLVALSPSKDVSIADTSTVTDLVRYSISLIIRETLTITDSLLTLVARAWTNATKHVSAWINQDKT